LLNGSHTRRLARQLLASDGKPTRLAHGIFDGYLYEVKVTHIENSKNQQEEQGQNDRELNESLSPFPQGVSPRATMTFAHAVYLFHLRLPSLITACLENMATVF
jgi:hypothetical protein